MPGNEYSPAYPDARYFTPLDRLVNGDLPEPQNFCHFADGENRRRIRSFHFWFGDSPDTCAEGRCFRDARISSGLDHSDLHDLSLHPLLIKRGF